MFDIILYLLSEVCFNILNDSAVIEISVLKINGASTSEFYFRFPIANIIRFVPEYLRVEYQQIYPSVW